MHSHSEAQVPVPPPSEATNAWLANADAALHRRRAQQSGFKRTLKRTRGRIAVVTDAASGLPVDTAAPAQAVGNAALGTVGEQITVAPIPVMIEHPDQGMEVYPEPSAELERDLPLAMAQGTPVRTSRPSPGRLAAIYRHLKQAGFAGIVSIHLSAELSGTVEAARLASEHVDIPVTVIDSRQAGLGLGQAVVDAAVVARTGGDLQETAEAADRTAAESVSVFVVPSLEQLRRGGRINRLTSLIGSLIRVKPVLGLRTGEIELLETTHSFPRSVQRLKDVVAEQVGQRPGARLGVHYFGNQEQATELAAAVAEQSAQPVPSLPLPPALAAHLGLGALAVTINPAA